MLFLSYSREDRKVVELIASIASDLELELWYDVHALPASRKWGGIIRTALTESDALLLVASQYSFESQNVRHEWEFAKSLGKAVWLLVIDSTRIPAELLSYSKCKVADVRQAPYSSSLLEVTLGSLSAPEASTWFDATEYAPGSPVVPGEISDFLAHLKRFRALAALVSLATVLSTPLAAYLVGESLQLVLYSIAVALTLAVNLWWTPRASRGIELRALGLAQVAVYLTSALMAIIAIGMLAAFSVYSDIEHLRSLADQVLSIEFAVFFVYCIPPWVVIVGFLLPFIVFEDDLTYWLPRDWISFRHKVTPTFGRYPSTADEGDALQQVNRLNKLVVLFHRNESNYARFLGEEVRKRPELDEISLELQDASASLDLQRIERKHSVLVVVLSPFLIRALRKRGESLDDSLRGYAKILLMFQTVNPCAGFSIIDSLQWIDTRRDYWAAVETLVAQLMDIRGEVRTGQAIIKERFLSHHATPETVGSVFTVATLLGVWPGFMSSVVPLASSEWSLALLCAAYTSVLSCYYYLSYWRRQFGVRILQFSATLFGLFLTIAVYDFAVEFGAPYGGFVSFGVVGFIALSPGASSLACFSPRLLSLAGGDDARILGAWMPARPCTWVYAAVFLIVSLVFLATASFLRGWWG